MLIFRQPFLDTQPRRADELPSRESQVAGHLLENKIRKDEGIGFRGGIELCFRQPHALKGVFKDVDAKRRDAVANLAEASFLGVETTNQTRPL